MGDIWTKSCECTQIAVVDVGQGSGLYIRTQAGKEIIIDTGETTKTLRNLSLFRYPWDRSINAVFLTHADRDHIGMSIDLVRRNDIGVLVVPPVETSDVISNILESEHGVTFASAGDVAVYDEVKVKILWPEILKSGKAISGKKIDKNESSLVLMLTVGNTKILVMGDAGEPTEKVLLRKYGNQLSADMLVVGHHGSKTSSSDEFVKTVSPEYSIIQVGMDNKFGHPHQSVLGTLRKYSKNILRTDMHGSILFKITGDGITEVIAK